MNVNGAQDGNDLESEIVQAAPYVGHIVIVEARQLILVSANTEIDSRFLEAVFPSKR